MVRTPLQQYLINLCQAWAKGAAGPVAPPAGLAPDEIRAALLATMSTRRWAGCSG